jgi:hypothetical protein
MKFHLTVASSSVIFLLLIISSQMDFAAGHGGFSRWITRAYTKVSAKINKVRAFDFAGNVLDGESAINILNTANEEGIAGQSVRAMNMENSVKLLDVPKSKSADGQSMGQWTRPIFGNRANANVGNFFRGMTHHVHHHGHGHWTKHG